MSETGDKFSIVLPVRNGADYIGTTITSVLSQTYTNFELIILENCSDDGTQTIINSFDDSRIQVYPSSSPLSIEVNWRRILDLDLNRYLTILGHDDLLYPDYLQEMQELILQYPDASLYHAHFNMIDREGALIRPCRKMPIIVTAEDFLRARQRGARDCYGTGYLMSTKNYLEVGGFPPYPQLIYSDDILLYQLTSKSYQVCSPHYLFAYRLHRNSISSSVDIANLYEASQRYIEFNLSLPSPENQDNLEITRRFVEQQFKGRVLQILLNLMISQDRQDMVSYQEQMDRAQAQAEHDELFRVCSKLISFFENVVFLNHPRTVKLIFARSVIYTAQLRRKIRDRYLQKLNSTR